MKSFLMMYFGVKKRANTECYAKLFSSSSCPLHIAVQSLSQKSMYIGTLIPMLSAHAVKPQCCKATMEREYQAFCDRCGQRLDWSKYEDAEVVYTGWSGPAANESDEQERETQFAQHSEKPVSS